MSLNFSYRDRKKFKIEMLCKYCFRVSWAQKTLFTKCLLAMSVFMSVDDDVEKNISSISTKFARNI